MGLSSSMAQEKKVYQLYDGKGKKTNYKKLLKAAKNCDVLLFGELHNNAIAHWLQIELVKDMDKEISLGAEMLEADDQQLLDAYLRAEIDYHTLDSLAGMWPNFKGDYLPLLDFAKEKKFAFTATNVPRKYASLVYKKGLQSLDSLTEAEKEYMAALPIPFDPDLPAYKQMLKMGHGHQGGHLAEAQAIKDASMAHFILQNREEGKPFVHFNGAYHSDYYEGIIWYLKKQAPNLKYLSISTVSGKAIQGLPDSHNGRADFILLVDEDVPTTY